MSPKIEDDDATESKINNATQVDALNKLYEKYVQKYNLDINQSK